MDLGKRYGRLFAVILMSAGLFFISACSGIKSEAKYPTGMDRNQLEDPNDIYSESTGIFGKGGVFGLRDDKKDGGGSSGIGVNSYLWRATLDTISFMPLASADPFGGVIITDWYVAPGTPNERIKLNVFILDKQLRSDAVQVKVFKQAKKGGNWVDATAAANTGRAIEDAILTRARQMRVAQIGEVKK